LPAEIPSRGDILPAFGNRRSRLCSLGADLGLFGRLRPPTAYHAQLRWQQLCPQTQPSSASVKRQNVIKRQCVHRPGNRDRKARRNAGLSDIL
jgi:hypothetical protein